MGKKRRGMALSAVFNVGGAKGAMDQLTGKARHDGQR